MPDDHVARTTLVIIEGEDIRSTVIAARAFMPVIIGWICGAGFASAQQPRAGARIDVSVNSARLVSVYERYRLPSDSQGVQLQLLERSCATIHDVTLSNSRAAVSPAVSNRGPWRLFHDTTGIAFSADSSGFDVSYRVELSGSSADIPVIHPTRAISRLEGEREGAVEVSVTLDDPKGAVRFPALTHDVKDNRWTGRFVAVPAFIHVDLKGAGADRPTTCDSAVAGGSDGGLSWRFWTLVSIMVAWVPLYLAWARRTPATDA